LGAGSRKEALTFNFILENQRFGTDGTMAQLDGRKLAVANRRVDGLAVEPQEARDFLDSEHRARRQLFIRRHRVIGSFVAAGHGSCSGWRTPRFASRSMRRAKARVRPAAM
jgi:hypothetical protein